MPALVLGGADLVLIAGVLVLIGFLLAARYTLTPLVAVLHKALGWVPGVGGLVDKADNAILGALDAAIDGSQRILADLYSGISWAVATSAHGLRDLALATYGAVNQLVSTTIPQRINAAVSSVRAGVNVLDARVDGAIAAAAHATSALEVRLSNTVAAAASSVALDAQRATAAVDDRLSGRIGRLEGTVDDKVAAARVYAAQTVASAAGALDTEIAQLRHATTLAIGDAAGELRGLIGQTASAAEREARNVLATAEGDVAAARSAAANATAGALASALAAVNSAAATASADTLAALHTAERELGAVAANASAETAAGIEAVQAAIAGVAGRVEDVVNIDLRGIGQQLRDFELPSLPATIAGLAALAGVVAVSLGESGLDTSNCRTKVKGICGVDPLRWESLLLALAPIGVGLSLRDLVEEGGRIAGGLGDMIRAVGEG